MAAFDSQTLALFEREREVQVVATRPDGSLTAPTTIWVVVDGDDVFIRSWRGESAIWYRAATERPSEVELIAADRRIPVLAVPATDDDSVSRCSAGLLAKYAGAPSAAGMVREEILATTLRVEPR